MLLDRRLEHLLAQGAQFPAQLFNLTATKGALQVGCDADVVVMEPGHTVYDPVASGHSVASWSPYAGMHLPWRVTGTWLRGAPVFDGARVLAAPGHGRFVRPIASHEVAVPA